MTKQNLIFLDIDGTLLRPDYTPNSNQLPKLIKKLEQKGFLFCLNSNRAMNDLKPLIKQFGINGPAIAENGTFWFQGDKIEYLVDVNPIKEDIELLLTDLSKKCSAKLIWADTVNFQWSEEKDTSLLWAANKFRKLTASIHVKTFGKANYESAKELANSLSARLGNDYSVYASPIFANVLVSLSITNKGEALREIKAEYFPGARVAMIGDDVSDLSTRSVVDRFYAVGNADQEVKTKADYVAWNQYTKGVEEILIGLDNGSIIV